MLSLSTFPLFLVAALILLFTPGPAVLYIVARAVDQGRAAAIASVLGIELGNMVHVLAAAFGLSAILMSSATAFAVVKYAGAGYLIYLGVRRLIATDSADTTVPFKRERLRRIFSQGVVVAVLNPKTALFFFAFLPQFVDPALGSPTLQLLTLGCIFVAMAIVTDGAYGLLADSVGARFKSTDRFAAAGRYVVGSVYIGLGLTTALAGARHR